MKHFKFNNDLMNNLDKMKKITVQTGDFNLNLLKHTKTL